MRRTWCSPRTAAFFAGRGPVAMIFAAGAIWHLLVAITLHKLRDQVKHHTTDKRNVQAEHRRGTAAGPIEALAREPGPLEAMALVEELQQLMRLLTPEQRRMLELRL